MPTSVRGRRGDATRPPKAARRGAQKPQSARIVSGSKASTTRGTVTMRQTKGREVSKKFLIDATRLALRLHGPALKELAKH